MLSGEIEPVKHGAAALYRAPQAEGVQKVTWWVIGLFISGTVIMTVLGLGSLVRWAFPAGAAAVAFFLYWRAPVSYVSFVWWLWFLSPFVRRIVDFRSGWADPSPILLAPPLATLVCVISVSRCMECWRNASALPFVFAFTGIAYGLVVGLVSLPLQVLVMASLTWVAPLVFGFHLYCVLGEAKDYPVYAKAIQRVFCWGTLSMGIYGLVQLVLAPAWDQLWMIQSAMESIGTPEPFGIRVFSTMNAPGPFAAVLAAGLLVLTTQRGLLAKVAMAAGYLSFVLSLARSAWLIWAVGAVVLAVREKKQAFRLAGAIVLVTACVAMLTAIDPIREIVQTRLQSFGSMQDDDSYQERRDGTNHTLGIASHEPFGRGPGAMDLLVSGQSGGLGAHDSGLLELFISLGWFGGLAYLGAFTLVGVAILKTDKTKSDLRKAARGVTVGFLSQLLLGSFMISVPGVVLWSFIGIFLAQSPDRLRPSPTGQRWATQTL